MELSNVNLNEMVGVSEMSEIGKVWNLGGVSVIGFSHEENGTLCQDAHAFRVTQNNEVVAAVADGAGSARLSHEGAKAFTTAIVDHLVSFLDGGSVSIHDASSIRSEIVANVNVTKKQLLETHAKSNAAEDHGGSLEAFTLRDFHATIIIAVCGVGGGAFYHVGDGAGAAFLFDDPEGAVVSKPENGEYANETYFVTEENWEEHLRVTPFSDSSDTILLMSDGVSGMAMTKGCEKPAVNFAVPLLKFLKKNDRETNELAVANTISKDSVRAITGDDKTLLWIIRDEADKI